MNATKKLATFFVVLLISILYYGAFWNIQNEEKFIEVRKLDAIQGNCTNITREDLEEYRILEKMLSGEDCTKFDENYWSCGVSDNEYEDILNFVLRFGKMSIESSFKVGDNCYMFSFGGP